MIEFFRLPRRLMAPRNDVILMAFLAMTIIVSPSFAEEARTAGKELVPKAITTADDQQAEENKEPPAPLEIETRYAPPFCDFEVTFPDRPYKAQKCPEGTGKCYDLTSYTMVYDHQTTVDVSVSCVPSSKAQYDRYNEQTIHMALKGMLNRVQLEDHKISTIEREEHRQGSLIGNGTHGRQGTIYNAQLWVGHNSVMTIEAKLIGSAHDEADAVFSEILRSIHEKRNPEAMSDLQRLIEEEASRQEQE